jgi:uncharacterized protein YeaO (DUF488 family)
MLNIQTKRIYEPPQSTDCFRVLVDRLWPRGISKDAAKLDLWAKDITPTTQLREDYHSGVDTWDEFAEKYRAELLSNSALSGFLEIISKQNTVTLLSAAKDIEHSHIPVLMEVLKQKLLLGAD